MEKFIITKIKAGSKETVEDFLASEVPLTITVAEKELVTLLCTPGDCEDLVRGFLFTSGLIKKAADIAKIVLNQEQWVAYVDLVNNNHLGDLVFKRLYTSGCGRGTLFYNALDIAHRSKIISHYTFEKNYISALMVDFQKSSHAYLKTGGMHSAAIADKKGIIAFREDIGRHNAIDKVVGYMISKNRSFKDKVIISSGRVSSEVLFKMQKCRIPIVISRSAPTNQAVRLARSMGITLVGFVRGDKMNIYSQEQRII
ncbi:formate dehydrogenase accessory sulfurtransferase FdhD [Candidatus Omnitrophota bacterium]